MSDRIIVLKGSPIVKEARAAAAGILPGHRLDLTLNAGVLEVGVGAAAGALTGAQRRAFAVELDVVGNTAADVYADNDDVKYVVAAPGDELQGRAVVSLTWATGAPLYAAAGGRVTDVPGTAIVPIGFALTDVAGSSADDLVPLEVA